MTLKDYVFGKKVTLISSFRKQEAIEQINRAAGSAFWPFSYGVTGGIYFGRVRLAWSVPLFNNSARPAFSGRLDEDLAGTKILGSFRAPTPTLAFYLSWYAFLVFLSLSFLAAFIADRPRTGDEWIMLVIVPFFGLIPFLFHWFFNRNYEEHLISILHLLEQEAGFKELVEPQPR